MGKTLTKADLRQFTGTETWYRHSLIRKITYTDGVQYVGEHGGAYWLIDEIALAQVFEGKVAGEEFQLWKLTVAQDKTAKLVCEDGNGRKLLTKDIPWTDFPLDEIAFYFIDNVILLASEY